MPAEFAQALFGVSLLALFRRSHVLRNTQKSEEKSTAGAQIKPCWGERESLL